MPATESTAQQLFNESHVDYVKLRGIWLGKSKNKTDNQVPEDFDYKRFYEIRCDELDALHYVLAHKLETDTTKAQQAVRLWKSYLRNTLIRENATQTGYQSGVPYGTNRSNDTIKAELKAALHTL